MHCVKTIENHSKEKPTDKNSDLKCVNGVAWNLCPQFDNQFVTVDEDSVLKLYKGDSVVPVLQETVSNGRMATVAIEPRTG